MPALLLLLTTLGVSTQNISTKIYGQKYPKVEGYGFSAVSVIFAALTFVVTADYPLNFELRVLPYSVGFAVTYGMAVVFTTLAVRYGPLALTSIFTAYSLLIPTAYGLLFLGEPPKATLLVGIALLLVSIVLVYWKRGDDSRPVTLKWVVFVLLAFLGNGACSTVQKVQQITFQGAYKNEFMLIAFAITAVMLFAVAFGFEKRDCARNLLRAAPYSAVRGFANGAVNYLVLVLATMLPSSVMFPIISAGNIITMVAVSVLVYKEKLTALQIVGVAVGILSVILLNL